MHTLVQLGKDLGLTNLVEGIETPEQLDYLHLEHCDQGQGFLFAEPLDADEVWSLLPACVHPGLITLPGPPPATSRVPWAHHGTRHGATWLTPP